MDDYGIPEGFFNPAISKAFFEAVGRLVVVSARLDQEVFRLWNALNPRDDIPTITMAGSGGTALTELCKKAARGLSPEDLPAGLPELLLGVGTAQLFRNEVIHTAFSAGGPEVNGHRGLNAAQRGKEGDPIDPSKMFSTTTEEVEGVVKDMAGYFEPIQRMLPGLHHRRGLRWAAQAVIEEQKRS